MSCNYPFLRLQFMLSDLSRLLVGRTIHTLKPRRYHHGWYQVEKFSKFVPPDTLNMHSLALSAVRFLSKTFSKLLEL